MRRQTRIFAANKIFVLAIFSLFITPVLAAYPDFRVQGDLPDGGTEFNVIAYNNSQSTPCDGIRDDSNDRRYFFVSGATGDANFDDNDDYNQTNLTTFATGTAVYFYFCDATFTIVNFTKTVYSNDTLQIDLGKVAGSSSVHDNLVNDYVGVCSNATGGVRLNTRANQTDSSTASYGQYYYLDHGDLTNTTDDVTSVYAYFTNSTVSECVFNTNTTTGAKIVIDAMDSFGVNATFEPDTLAQGDL